MTMLNGPCPTVSIHIRMTTQRVNARLALCLNCVFNVKVLEVAINQEKALVGAFSVIVKTNGSFAALAPTSQVLASVPEKDAGLLEPLKELGCTTTHNNMDTVTHRQEVKL